MCICVCIYIYIRAPPEADSFSGWASITKVVINKFSYMLCVIECYVIVFLINEYFRRGGGQIETEMLSNQSKPKRLRNNRLGPA